MVFDIFILLIVSMLNVNFRKWVCLPVELKGQGQGLAASIYVYPGLGGGHTWW